MRVRCLSAPSTTQGFVMLMDFAYVGLTVVLFALSWGLVRLLERVS